MNRRDEPRRFRRVSGILFLALILASGEAFALSLSVTQIGGTAIDGRGQIGDTIEVAVDVVIEADEAITGVFPTLIWDQEGGNVIDLRSARYGRGVLLGEAPFAPLGDRSTILLSNWGERTGREDRYFNDLANIDDHASGRTLMLGFNLAPLIFDNDALLLAIISNGFPGPLSIRMGVATLELASLGETTVGFYQDPASTLQTIITGVSGTRFPNGDVEFSQIPVSAVGFGGLRIVVVPEPGTALLAGLGLGLLAACSRNGRSAAQPTIVLRASASTQRGPDQRQGRQAR